MNSAIYFPGALAFVTRLSQQLTEILYVSNLPSVLVTCVGNLDSPWSSLLRILYKSFPFIYTSFDGHNAVFSVLISA